LGIWIGILGSFLRPNPQSPIPNPQSPIPILDFYNNNNNDLIYKLFARQLNKLIIDKYYWKILWNSIQDYQKYINNIRNFAKRKEKSEPKSLNNCRILSNIPVRCKLKETMLIAQIGKKLAEETLKHHPQSHGFLPNRGVETFMLELAKYSKIDQTVINSTKIERRKERIEEIVNNYKKSK
jgi:hypothetical protein